MMTPTPKIRRTVKVQAIVVQTLMAKVKAAKAIRVTAKAI